MCKVEAPNARPTRGETSELRDTQLVVGAIYSCWGARACLGGLGQRVGLQILQNVPLLPPLSSHFSGALKIGL